MYSSCNLDLGTGINDFWACGKGARAFDKVDRFRIELCHESHKGGGGGSSESERASERVGEGGGGEGQERNTCENTF
jgi:hypothetical protein